MALRIKVIFLFSHSIRRKSSWYVAAVLSCVTLSHLRDLCPCTYMCIYTYRYVAMCTCECVSVCQYVYLYLHIYCVKFQISLLTHVVEMIAI